MSRRTLLMGVALTAVLIAVAGCGRRGALEAPPGLTVSPKPAASERLVAPVAQVTTSDSGSFDEPSFLVPDPAAGQNKSVAVAPAPIDPNKPKKRFLLDSLVK
jgi:predicted small lipoprotein YifL